MAVPLQIAASLGIGSTAVDLKREPLSEPNRPTALQIGPYSSSTMAFVFQGLFAGNVVPALQKKHPDPKPAKPIEPATSPNLSAEVLKFCEKSDKVGLLKQFALWKHKGLSHEAALHGVIAGCARQLGEDWKQDLRRFDQVTDLSGQLEQLAGQINLLYFGESEQLSSKTNKSGLRILLLPAPNEQHSLGLTLLANSLRALGYEVDELRPAIQSRHNLENLSDAYQLVGVSIGSRFGLEGASDCLAHLKREQRRARKNKRKLNIMLGGPWVCTNSTQAHSLAVDYCYTDLTPGLSSGFKNWLSTASSFR